MSDGRTLYVLRDGPPSVEAALLGGLLDRESARSDAAVCLLRPVSPWPALAGARVFTVPAGAGRRAFPPRSVVGMVADVASTLGVKVVHSLGAESQVVGGRAARRAGVASVWSQLGVASWKDLVSLSAALARSDVVLAYSGASERAQRRLPGGRRCRRLAPGVVLPGGDREERRWRAREACGVPQDALVAALAAPTSAQEAELEGFLRAVSSLCHAREQAHVILPPPVGVDRASLEATVAWTAPTLAKLGRAHIAPALPDAAAVVCDAADLAVFSAHGTGLPLALLQAMAAEAAVIAVDTPLVREFVEPGEHAVLVPAGDHEALATALLALGDDQTLRSTLAAAGAELARERHDAAVMAKEIDELYASLP